jgi:predicted secreted Zn-dependent protease
MRRTVLTCLVAIGTLCGPEAFAGTRAVIQTWTYDVTGSSGAAFIDAMDSKGPRHGFMTHAIATTAYTVDWDLGGGQENGFCRLRRVNGTLNLFYTFPRIASPMTPALKRRWSRFFAGVRGHEETHGRIAREMMRTTERSITGLRVANDPSCYKTRREARRRIQAVYAEYEARQNAFDRREHSRGGHVEHLIAALIRKP